MKRFAQLTCSGLFLFCFMPLLHARSDRGIKPEPQRLRLSDHYSGTSDYGFRGKVRTCTFKVYLGSLKSEVNPHGHALMYKDSFDRNGYVVRTVMYNMKGEVDGIGYPAYDQYGSLIGGRDEGGNDENKVTSIHKVDYNRNEIFEKIVDKNGKTINAQTERYDAGGNLIYRERAMSHSTSYEYFDYDKYDNLISSVYRSSDNDRGPDTTLYVYNKKSMKVAELRYSSGSPFEKIIFTYRNNRLFEEGVYDAREAMVSKKEYEYAGSETIAHEYFYLSDGSPDTKRGWIYKTKKDAMEKVVSEQVFDRGGVLVKQQLNEYIYDRYDNVIKETKFSNDLRDPRPENVKEYIFTYY